MYVVTPVQMRKIDQRAIDEFGIPGIVLMENAALRVVEKLYSLYSLKKRDRVVVLAGGGITAGMVSPLPGIYILMEYRQKLFCWHSRIG